MIFKLLVLVVLFSTNTFSQAATTANCADKPDLSHFYSQSWGIDVNNRRFQRSENTRINASNVNQLELAWVFGFEDSTSPHSYPLVTPDTVFIGAEEGVLTGRLYALDRQTGCLRWQLETDGNIRTAIEHGTVTENGETRTLLFFGTFAASAYAVDAATGDVVWEKEMDDHAFSMVTGSPVFKDDVLYVPISAYEVVVASTSLYGCCSFRGSVVALDATTGKEIWRHYTINREAEVKGTRWLFVDTKGPSGAPVWQSPTLDATRGRLYFATGENFSDPATDTSDSVFAIDLEDGAKIWHRQFTEGDAWNSACGGDSPGANCPDANGPDYDFGAPPILTRTFTGKDILLAGQKSGMVYAMNPDTGHVLWQKRIGRGGKLGGIHWGMAVNEDLGLLYVPISDRNTGPPHDHKPDPGLHALRIEDGALQWSVAPPANCDGREGCFEGISAAIIASTDLVIIAGLDGGLHALSATTGESLWRYDAWRSFDAVNGIETNGGPFDVHGPMLADDMLFISSGYKSFGQKEGNAFLAFRLK